MSQDRAKLDKRLVELKGLLDDNTKEEHALWDRRQELIGEYYKARAQLNKMDWACCRAWPDS